MRSPRLRPALVVVALSAGLLVPVGVAGSASAAPCVEIIPGVPLCPQPAATTPPTVTGTRQVGETVTATAPVWDQADVVTSYQWLRGGEAISGATMAAYTLTGEDFDEMISVRASGQGSFLLPGTSDSETFEPAKGEAITVISRPVVTGSATVGGTLTTTGGDWGAPEPSFTYQWYRSRFSGNGAELIAGATTASYVPVAADSGRAVIALVVAERIGYEKGAALSNNARLPKAVSTAALSLPRRTVRRTQAPGVRVVLGSRAGLTPTGLVTIYDGGRRVRSFTLTAAAQGAVTFQIARQTVGRHRLTVRYAGDTAHRPSTSGVQVLTVTR
ncbi:Ig-like domain repeat protein [Nocardioides sp.]|uniref:Ig-like domain repeat protein n=1 Tax=Nocardioides sp. TaxID=35761 RepID=UPI0027224B2D|nr:Ig-like domain repeat protein [Nocardioides sp.]MDO9454781.1 Ig-like domain repeat protein [Nocardioides sp.]